MSALFVTISALVTTSVYSERDFSWFKETQYHNDNIEALKNSWFECPDWNETYSNIGGKLHIELDEFGRKISFDVNSAKKFNFSALCITVQVPLNWDDPTLDRTINYTISRIYTRDDIDNTANNGAMWMIPGGPGGTAASMYDLAVPVSTFLDGSYDIYIHDHRGVGYSTLFECPNYEDDGNATACSLYTQEYWGDNSYFGTYHAAADLGYTIDLFNGNFSAYNGDNHVIYGVSYGTYFLNRYLQLYPDQVRAIILDGLCAGDTCKLIEYDSGSDIVAKRFFDRCGDDAFCNAQFVSEYGDDIAEAMESIYALFDANNGNMPCNNGTYGKNITRSQFSNALFFALVSDYDRMVILPILKRMARCTDEDKAKLDHQLTLYAVYADLAAPSNTVLDRNIIYSELWDYTPGEGGTDLATLLTLEDTYYVSAGVAPALRQEFDQWIKYVPPSDLYNKYADPQIPILLINGDLDPQTPVEWAEEAADAWNTDMDDGNYRYYVEVPNAPHVVILATPIVNYTDYSADLEHNFEACGMYIVKSFIDDPYSTPDTSCLNWLIPLDWEISTNISKQVSNDWLNTRNAWGEINDIPTTTDVTDNANNIQLGFVLFFSFVIIFC